MNDVQVSVTQAGNTLVDIESTQVTVQVGGVLSQQNLWTGPVQPGFTVPGIWVETGLGPNGEDFTIWIEDGK